MTDVSFRQTSFGNELLVARTVWLILLTRSVLDANARWQWDVCVKYFVHWTHREGPYNIISTRQVVGNFLDYMRQVLHHALSDEQCFPAFICNQNS